MENSLIERVVSQVFTEKALHDFYCKGNTCVGWERNVIDQPEAVQNIVNKGADRIAAGYGVGNSLPDSDIAGKIDHTFLKADATSEEITKLCAEAREFRFASVCVNPSFVSLCADKLRGSGVKVCTVIGFPLGANTTKVKRLEAEEALNNGATEIDMVLNIGRLKDKDHDYIFNDINQVALEAKKHNAILKVIIETSLLTDEEKIKACVIAKAAKADYVKTSTGFSTGGATAGDVALMKYVVGSTVGVKASGGIRSQEDAKAMIESGADRIGASASVKIVVGEKGGGDGY